jgi:hypothetical protein
MFLAWYGVIDFATLVNLCFSHTGERLIELSFLIVKKKGDKIPIICETLYMECLH